MPNTNSSNWPTTTTAGPQTLLALVDVSMSRQPAKNIGLLATIPTGCPSILAKPTVMFFAQSGMISKYVLSSTTYSRALQHARQRRLGVRLVDVLVDADADVWGAIHQAGSVKHQGITADRGTNAAHG